MVERQELFCHDCQKYVQFDIDLSLDGNHVFECPNCKHEHCRVVRDGKITDIRWDQRNGPTYCVSYLSMTTSSSSTYTVYISNGGSSSSLYDSWMNTTSVNATT